MSNSSFWNSKRVLLTGHTGFKGSWLLLWLQYLGAQVFTFSLAPEGKPNLFDHLLSVIPPGSNWHHHIGDLTDFDSINTAVSSAQPDVVFHLAAQPLVRRSYEDPLATWSTNVMGSLHLLEALKTLNHPCAVVMVTTDKVYENREWSHGYRETDPLGGRDPYSASKAGAEIAISSWRSSFCGHSTHQTPHLRIATARAGNVIGGGDYAQNRIVPDCMRSLSCGDPIIVRNPKATRPWQHVLEPLSGYLRLAEVLLNDRDFVGSPFNFGPTIASNRSVSELVSTILEYWPGSFHVNNDPSAPHEANFLHLQIDKSHHLLNWHPVWDYSTTVRRTVEWYRSVNEGACPIQCCFIDLNEYINSTLSNP